MPKRRPQGQEGGGRQSYQAMRQSLQAEDRRHLLSCSTGPYLLSCWTRPLGCRGWAVHQAVRRVRHVGAVGVLAELAAPPAGCRLQAEGGQTHIR